MSNRKTYNSIVFLTVYLGLALVGASPQVLAQNAKQTVESNKINILVPGEGYVFTFDLNPFIELNKLVSAETLPIKLSGKLIPAHQKFTDWEIITVTGNQKITDFLRKEFFTAAVLNPPTLPLPAKELFQSVEIDKDNIILTRNTTFKDSEKASAFGESFRRIIEYVKTPTSEKAVAGNLYLKNTQVRFVNNQVFIVTRLPRASIDSLLAQKDAQ